MRHLGPDLSAGLALCLLTSPALAQLNTVGVSSERGAFWLQRGGRLWKGHEMVDHPFTYRRADGPTLQLRIERFQEERHRPDWPAIGLLDVRLIQADGSAQPLCKPDADGRELAIPYPDASAPDGFRFTCSSGANGKCLRSGYLPWHAHPGGLALAPFHKACVHLLRADYGGDGRSWTQPGVLVDLSDRLGVMDPEPDLLFEAGWGPHGAVCLARPRLPQTHSLQEIGTAVPRLKPVLGPDRCTEERARQLGAILFSQLPPD